MKTEDNKSLKITLIVFAAIYEIFAIIQMIIAKGFDYGYIFTTFALAALIVYLFIFKGKKFMNLVVAGAFFMLTVLKFIGFIDAIVALSRVNKFYTGVEVFLLVFNLLIVLIELPLFALVTYLSIVGYNKTFVLNAKTTILLLSISAIVSLLVNFLAVFIYCLSESIEVGRLILTFIFSVIAAFGEYGCLLYFVFNENVPGLEFNGSNEKDAEPTSKEEAEVEVEEPTQEEVIEEKSE